ncbi:hypothetical protein EDS67_22100 [candidate division KSB1 bacterium]|nr:MAG: hypothetical protein EDS67_22100 [candidate division KSB1 bacterium]MBC6951222.1 hypothetical protein [candidate division KSB1 bacterium]MCE7944305.1 hypothetical protein [Chlorobi bacterium CHB1]
MLKLLAGDSQVPPEVSWARDFQLNGVLPDFNPVFTKALLKIFHNKLVKNTPLLWNISLHVGPGNHRFKTRHLRNAAKHLGKIQGKFNLAHFDKETAEAIVRVADHINTAKRIVNQILEKMEATYRQNHHENRLKAALATGKMACLLKRAIEKENKRRKSCNPRLPVYRNQWKLVISLMKEFGSSNINTPYFTPSVDSVRQLAYRYRCRTKRQASKRRK